jgi:DNA-binding transcriptional LysR family regulator
VQLDLNLLTALNALLEEESVGGAADRLHLSQPAMSRSLGRIRALTGDPILIRTGRTMTPTPRAIAMRDEVRSLVLRSGSVLSPVTELDLATLRRTFTLRAHDALTSVIAPSLVRHAASSAPRVAFRFLGEASADTSDLSRGSVDLEIGSSLPRAADVAHEHIGDDDLVGLSRPGNPLFERDISLAEFCAAPHVIVSRRGRLDDSVDAALTTARRARTVVASVASTAAALEIVRDTDAVVVVPASISRRSVRDGSVRSFALPVQLPPVPVVLAWHGRLSTDLAHTWLRETVTRAVREALSDIG